MERPHDATAIEASGGPLNQESRLVAHAAVIALGAIRIIPPNHQNPYDLRSCGQSRREGDEVLAQDDRNRRYEAVSSSRVDPMEAIRDT